MLCLVTGDETAFGAVFAAVVFLPVEVVFLLEVVAGFFAAGFFTAGSGAAAGAVVACPARRVVPPAATDNPSSAPITPTRTPTQPINLASLAGPSTNLCPLFHSKP